MSKLLQNILFFILFSFLLSVNIQINIPEKFPSTIRDNHELSLVIGIMVEFQEEINDDPATSGNGLFLQSLEENINYINYDNIFRCNPNSHMLLDPPPHNSAYFRSQLVAIQNYYSKLYESEQFAVHMVDSIFTVSQQMKNYAYSNIDITELYVESIELAKNKIEDYLNLNDEYNFDNTIIVVFHAGLGQDFAAPLFDPTPYDIHSAYIDNEMINDYINESNNINQFAYNFGDGILLPETLNMIYYDVVEDWYSPTLTNITELENSYCDIQFGMTGLFAYFLGYRFGFQPMHNTQNVTEVESQGFSVPTRIGQFGLMDIGMFNGRGVMPALPNPYTRSKFNIGTTDNITLSTLENQFSDFDISQRMIEDNIVKLSISNNEYFLFENSNNEFYYDSCNRNYSIDDLKIFFETECNYLQDGEICDYDCDGIEDQEIENAFWLDIAKDNNLFLINTETGVIEGILDNNYDLGMPGSGILLWHVDESKSNNNDRDHKMVHLEEADGIVNIGLSEPFFGSGWIIDGWHNDYWFEGNDFYNQLNSSNNTVIINETSIPNSNLNSGSPSYFNIEILSPISDNMVVSISTVNNYFNIQEIDTDIDRILGNDGQCMFYVGDNALTINEIKTYGSGEYCDEIHLTDLDFSLSCSKNLDDFDNDDIILFHPDFNGLCLLDQSNFFIDSNGSSNIFSYDNLPLFGYSDNLDELAEFELNNSASIVPGESSALGDIDQDGFDELINYNLDGELYISNYNGSILNGFPIKATCTYPLIADIINDDYPEILCNSDDMISIYSYNGVKEFSIPNYGLNMKRFLLTNEYNQILFINGNKVITFDKIHNGNINDNIYWSNMLSTTFNIPIVQGPSIANRILLSNNIQEQSQFGIDLTKTYNYPNPFSEVTKFRYFVGISESVDIKIYDVAGFLIDEISDKKLVPNEYNEISWDGSSYKPGLYFAALNSDFNETKLIKLLIID